MWTVGSEEDAGAEPGYSHASPRSAGRTNASAPTQER